ncbi:hypothetical protein ACJJTC_015359 [Scirpophaga incertulas]
MDKNYIKTLLDSLKSTSSARIQEALLKIRSKIITSDSGIKLFRECGGLDYLLPHLRKPNERILDITLSILGNCCLEEESNTVVGKLNSFSPLVSILKTVCRDSIVGRACRVIGNLAQKNSNAESLHNHGVVAALVSLIESRDKNTSYPTLTMAVRAIRQLWAISDKRDEMLTLNAVGCIALLLTNECETAGIIKSSTNMSKDSEGFRKSQEELISGILKCIGYFTIHTTIRCAEQIQGDGRGYQCLVALTKSYESLALKCLMNLCYLSTCRPILGTAGLVECLVGILKKHPDVSWWPEGAARALAQLSGESVNRSRLRHCGGLPLLVNAARASPHAMHALLQYVFDDTAFQILVNEGLVALLTDELTKYLTTMEFEHNNMEADTTEKNNSKLPINTFGSSSKEVPNKLTVPISSPSDNATSNLFARRKSHLPSKSEDELKVVIERDNMIVGFVDAIESDATDESQSDSELSQHRQRLKRARSVSPQVCKKKPQLIKIASKDWSAGVYWEPKSPEWPTGNQSNSSRIALSPERSDHGPLSPYSDGYQSGFSPDYGGGSCSKRPRWDWSPESEVSSGSTSPYWNNPQWSPSSSSSTSRFSINEDSSDSEVSGRYSPVCSDTEGESTEFTVAKNAMADLDTAQVAQDLDELIMEDEESIDDQSPLGDDASKLEIEAKTSRIACVFVLLFRVSHGACGSSANREDLVSSNTLESLTGEEVLNALLDYIERCKRPLGRAARILDKVLSNALCLMSILRHRLALRLHNMSVNSKHPPNKCQQCKQVVRISTKLLAQLTILAESSYGIGEISYQLLKGNSTMKQTLSLTLPYIVRTEKPLKKYFIDCSALNFLFTIITDSNEEIQVCVTALGKLATNVHIKDPKTLENRFQEQVCVSYDPILDNLSSKDIVTFELDDLSTVRANRIFLCQNSEYFSAMLMGYFKESIEKCVRLTDVTKPGLEYLLTLLHCGLNNTKCDVQVFPMAEKLETNLEVLLLADRFLFDKIKELLSSAILQFQMTPESAHKIYIWSLSKGMGFLCVEAVAYLLTGKMCESIRTCSFQEILRLEYKDQWLEDIRYMIRRQMMK